MLIVTPEQVEQWEPRSKSQGWKKEMERRVRRVLAGPTLKALPALLITASIADRPQFGKC